MSVEATLVIRLLATLAIGFAGGFVLRRLHVPGGYMIGALVASAAFSVSTAQAWVPADSRIVVQVLAGAYLACTMQRSDITRMKTLGRPLLLLLGSFTVIFVIVGMGIWTTTDLNLKTALMSAIPGGINDVPIVAADMGCDAPTVAVLQMVRFFIGLAIFPSMIEAYDTLRTKAGHPRPDHRSGGLQVDRILDASQPARIVVLTMVVATAAGLIGYATGIPGFTFACAIIGVLILKIGFDRAYVPRWLLYTCQVLSGSYLGTLLSFDGLMAMGRLWPAILIIIVVYTAHCFLLGHFESTRFGFGRKEGMLIASPAGAVDMALIIKDLDVTNTDVIVLQVIRAVSVMVVLPQVVNVVSVLFGGDSVFG